MSNLRKTIVILMLLLMSAMLVQAKVDPFVEDQDEEWGGLDTPVELSLILNTGLYGQLDDAEDIDAFLLSNQQAKQSFKVRVMVPMCADHFSDFYPSLAIVGPGLDMPDSDVELPFELSKGDGVLILEETRKLEKRVQGTWQLFDQWYYRHTLHLVDLPHEGDYQLVVWEPDGNVGAYNIMISNNTKHQKNPEHDDADFKATMKLVSSGAWMGTACE